MPNLDDALVLMELEPVHSALRALVEPELVRQLAGHAEEPSLIGSGNRKSQRERKEFIETAWTRFEALFHAVQQAPPALIGNLRAHDPVARLEASSFRECLRSAVSFSSVEAFFPKPWNDCARHVLPSPSPRDTATALWGPVLAWCVLDCLASTIAPDQPHLAALELFDRLRLRESLAQAFQALGIMGEESWRAAARVRVLLLDRTVATPLPSATEAASPIPPASEPPIATPVAQSTEIASEIAVKADRPAKTPVAIVPPEAAPPHPATAEPGAAFPPLLWLDSDVRWLTGVHDAAGHSYLVREPFEELLWWLQLPRLLTLAGHPEFNRQAAAAIAKSVDDAIAAVAAAGYQADKLLAFDRRSRKKDAATRESTEIAPKGEAKKPDTSPAKDSRSPAGTKKN